MLRKLTFAAAMLLTAPAWADITAVYAMAGGDQLRVEYRYDLRGLSAGGALVLSEERELTEIFCLACGQEVDDVAPADGQLAGGAQGFSKRGGPGA